MKYNKHEMILHRFCSQREFDAYMHGDTLQNTTDHYRGGFGGSKSRGFCFFRGSPEKWARRLQGIADFDILLTVEVNPKYIVESTGYMPIGQKMTDSLSLQENYSGNTVLRNMIGNDSNSCRRLLISKANSSHVLNY